MKKKILLFLLVLSGLMLIWEGSTYSKDPSLNRSGQSKDVVNPSKGEGREKPGKGPPATSHPSEPDPEFVRGLFFKESDPDFTFPARKKRYIYHGLRERKEVALTFDDGPNPQYTSALLSILKKKKVKATFFVTGENAKNYPQIVREIIESGCEVGNHSFSHPNLRKIPAEKVREELEKTQSTIKEACGQAPVSFRPPFGTSGEQVARIAFLNRLDPVFWSIDTNDYKKDVAREDIVKTVLEGVKGGSIILMHDKSQKVLDSVREIIDPLREKGLTFVTCSEMAIKIRGENFSEREKGKSEK